MRLISIFVLLLILRACYTVGPTKSYFTQCHTSNLQSPETELKTDGYYEIKVCCNENDSTYLRTNTLFFSGDGVYVQVDFKNQLSIFTEGDAWTSKAVRVGTYKIQGSDVSVQYIRIGSTTSRCFSKKLKIIDLNTLVLESFEYCPADSAFDYISGVEFSKAEFVPSDTVPDYDKLWLKQQKWFWCDKQAYKRWKADNH